MKVIIPTIFVLAVSAMAVAAKPAPKEIYRVSITERADGKGYVVRLHSRGKVHTGDLTVRQDELQSAVVTLTDASVVPRMEEGEAAGPVLAYTVEATSGDVRVRLSLDPDRPVQIVAYADRDSDDALIALAYANVAPRPVRGESVEPASTVVFASLPEGTDADSPESVESPEVAGAAWKLDCVVIDAGHGGKDTGAIAHGVREKDVNLAVAKKLGYYIEHRLGLRVVYTRTDDRFVSLRERGRIANEECGKLFISLHVNAARRSSANGTEIYFLGLHKTQAALDVMERENSVIRLESNPDQYVDLSSEQAIMETMAHSVYLRESELLADLVHHQFKDRAMRPTRGVKQAGFLVLWKASMPAVLVELGFVTNKQEARYLKSSRGHDLLASAIFRAVRSFRDTYQRGITWAPAE